MSTRCGSIDPGVLIYLAAHEHLDMPRIQNLLHAESACWASPGLSGDMRTLLASSDPRAKEAIDLFVYRAARDRLSRRGHERLDALVFTGGIGEHAAARPRDHLRSLPLVRRGTRHARQRPPRRASPADLASRPGPSPPTKNS